MTSTSPGKLPTCAVSFPHTAPNFKAFTIEKLTVSRPDGAHLLETEDSKNRRVPKPLDHGDILQLRRTVSKEAGDKAEQALKASQANHADEPTKNDDKTTSTQTAGQTHQADEATLHDHRTTSTQTAPSNA